MAMNYGIVGPYSLQLSVPPLVAFLLGGGSNIARVALTGIVLGIAQSLGSNYLGVLSGGFLGSHYQDIVILFVLAFAWPVLQPKEPRATHVAEVPERSHYADKAAIGTVTILGVAPLLLHEVMGQRLDRLVALSIPSMVISVGLYCAIRRARVADLGYLTIPAVGAYVFALLRSDHLVELLGLPDQGVVLASPWLSLGLAALLGAVVAAAIYAAVGRRHAIHFAIFALALVETALILLNNLDAPVNITNGPRGIGGIIGFGNATATAIVGSIVLAGCVVLVMVTGASNTNLRGSNYIAAGAIGGLGGAMMAASQGFISPESFSSFSLVNHLLIVFIGMRFGVSGVITSALILPILLRPFPTEWNFLILTSIGVLSLYVHSGVRQGVMSYRGRPFGQNPYRG